MTYAERTAAIKVVTQAVETQDDGAMRVAFRVLPRVQTEIYGHMKCAQQFLHGEAQARELTAASLRLRAIEKIGEAMWYWDVPNIGEHLLILKEWAEEAK